MPLATNAPATWPAVSAPEGPLPAGAFRLQVAAALAAALRAKDTGPRLAGLRETLLLEDGVLEAPLVVEDAGRRTPVLVYETADVQAARHYAAAVQASRRSGTPEPVYYAPGPVPHASASRLPPFGPEHVTALAGDPPEGPYAMWWPTPDEPDFQESRVAAALSRAVHALDGLASYAVAPYAARLGLVPGDAERVRLRGDPLVAPVRGPQGVPLLFTASRERGLGWRIRAEGDLAPYRDRLWAQFAEGAEALRAKADAGDWPRDPPEENSAPAWWVEARDAAGPRAFGVSTVSRSPEGE